MDEAVPSQNHVVGGTEDKTPRKLQAYFNLAAFGKTWSSATLSHAASPCRRAGRDRATASRPSLSGANPRVSPPAQLGGLGRALAVYISPAGVQHGGMEKPGADVRNLNFLVSSPPAIYLANFLELSLPSGKIRVITPALFTSKSCGESLRSRFMNLEASSKIRMLIALSGPDGRGPAG